MSALRLLRKETLQNAPQERIREWQSSSSEFKALAGQAQSRSRSLFSIASALTILNCPDWTRVLRHHRIGCKQRYAFHGRLRHQEAVESTQDFQIKSFVLNHLEALWMVQGWKP
jgi:hypothetical protein